MRTASAFLALLATTLLPGGHPMTQPKITISPTPPSPGDTITITYSGTLPVTLNLDWDPAAEPSTITITSKGGATVVVPADATSLKVTDPTPGGAEPCSTVINP